MAQFHIWKMCRLNPSYDYQFYNDEDIEAFLKEEFDEDVFEQYSKLNIGAAKADFFRYAILLKKGGIYLDIDSQVRGSLDAWIQPLDKAIITKETNPGYYVQWCLIYEKGHPFLQKTLDAVLDNIRTNRYPNEVLEMTGPNMYSRVLEECFKKHPTTAYRMFGVDYEGKVKFKYWLSGFSFGNKEHWRVNQQKRGVLKGVKSS